MDHLQTTKLFARPSRERGCQRLAVEDELAFLRRQQSGDDARQRALAAARLAHDRDRALPADCEIDALQDARGSPVARGHAVYAQQRLLRRGLCGGLAVGAYGEKLLRVVLRRVIDDAVGRSFFHKVAVAQHHDAVGHLGDDCEIVADIDGGRIELPDHVLDRGEHLDLGGDVERRRRLVEDDEVGAA